MIKKNTRDTQASLDSKRSDLKKIVLDLNSTLLGIFHFVESRQDDHKSAEEISFPEQMNIFCDKLASDYYTSKISTNMTFPHHLQFMVHTSHVNQHQSWNILKNI